MLMWPPPPQPLHNTHNGKPAIPHTFCPEENVMHGGVGGGRINMWRMPVGDMGVGFQQQKCKENRINHWLQ
jgi:hypothetical protein